MTDNIHLKRALGPFLIWGLGVGYVISGMYFGWNLGLEEAGPYNQLIALVVVTVLYASFVGCYAELACAIPRAGGAFDYARMALGERAAFATGMAQVIEFVFAPPAIAAAIGAYFSLFFPSISPLTLAVIAYLIFTALNMYGVEQSAKFELIVTVFAVTELLIFVGFTLPNFSWAAFSKDAIPVSGLGIMAALPFAIWFYLAIEGIANVAEETKNPQRTLSRGFLYAMSTLALLAILVFFSSIGVNGWRAIVYLSDSTVPSDSPLPLALSQIVGSDSVFYHLLISIGLFGLVASFHGIILISGRALLEMGRARFLPKFLGVIHPTRKTPVNALLCNFVIGLVALFTGKTSQIIIFSVLGALSLYFISMLSFFRLRKRHAELERPFRAPFFPLLPTLALLLSGLCIAAMIYTQPTLALLYFSLLFGAYLLYAFFKKGSS